MTLNNFVETKNDLLNFFQPFSVYSPDQHHQREDLRLPLVLVHLPVHRHLPQPPLVLRHRLLCQSKKDHHQEKASSKVSLSFCLETVLKVSTFCFDLLKFDHFTPSLSFCSENHFLLR